MNPAEFTQLVRGHTLAHKTFSKIFSIGFNKTGTTTLEGVLQLYGYSMPIQAEQELQLTGQTFAGNYEPLRNFVARYDAFQDLPFAQANVYVVCDALFPNSKFILTERDPEIWFNSMCNFHKKVFGLDSLENLTEQDVYHRFKYLFDGYVHISKRHFLTMVQNGQPTTRWDLLYNKDYYISRYLQRNEEIKIYFRDRPKDLLVLDITQTPDTTTICNFLDIPPQFSITMPHLNKT